MDCLEKMQQLIEVNLKEEGHLINKPFLSELVNSILLERNDSLMQALKEQALVYQ